MSEKTMLDDLVQNSGGGSVTDMGEGYIVKGTGLAVMAMMSACIRALMCNAEFTGVEIAGIVAASVASAEKGMAREAGRQVQ